MRIVSFLAVIALIFGLAFWWLMLDARAPGAAEGVFDIGAYRALVEDDEGPAEVRMELVGEDAAPGYAVETGGGRSHFALAYTAFQLVYPDAKVVIGGAVDAETASQIAQSGDAQFYPDAYQRLLDAISDADAVWITHEHLDHVMAIARHPAPETFTDALLLTPPQLDALPKFAPEGGLDPAFGAVEAVALDAPARIEPGVVAAPAPGHSPGSLVFYVRRADGQEYLFIGDIVWAMSNIERLKTRPRLLQYLFFDPDEDRPAVLKQVRALHDLAEAEPDLAIVPNHDSAHIGDLAAQGVLARKFD